MSEWWPVINTLIGIVLLVFGWTIRRGVAHIDELMQARIDIEKAIVHLEGRVEAHETLDDERFKVHESWLGRIDTRLDAADRRERFRS